jgi:transposase
MRRGVRPREDQGEQQKQSQRTLPLRALPGITWQREGRKRRMRAWNRSHPNKNISSCAPCSMSSNGDTRLSAEAQRRGSASTVAREAGVSLNTVKRGLREREAGQTYHPGARIRRPGAGRKKLAKTDPTLLTDLEQALEPKGDPMSLVRWTTKSLAQRVASALGQRPSHQEVSAGRTAPRAGVFPACQQEDDRGGSASRP